MKTTEQNIRMIAEFMGGKDQSKLIGGANEILFESPSYGGSKRSKIYIPFANLKYHTSWDCLMAVISKIDKLMLDQPIDSPFEVNAEEIFTSLREVNIKLTFNKVCQFIEWYNENVKKS